MIPKKIDLHEKMTKEMENPFTEDQLKKVEEFKKNAELDGDETLKKLGLDHNLETGKDIYGRQERLRQDVRHFDQDKVFHISQIKSIARKYHLKFLPVRYYNGNIDEELPNKIRQFEIANDHEVSSSRSHIMAPAPNFDIQEPQRPIDPLFFYQVNEEYYYLIHKWGDDITNYRRLLSIGSTYAGTYVAMAAIFTLLSIIAFKVHIGFGALIAALSVIGILVTFFMNFDSDKQDGAFTIVEKITASKDAVEQRYGRGGRGFSDMEIPRDTPPVFDVDTPKRFGNPSLIYA